MQEAVHKRCPQSGGICPVHTFCKQWGFFRCGRLHFLVQKASDSLIIMCVRTDNGGGVLSQCEHFADY